jgi:hypothetical protein
VSSTVQDYKRLTPPTLIFDHFFHPCVTFFGIRNQQQIHPGRNIFKVNTGVIPGNRAPRWAGLRTIHLSSMMNTGPPLLSAPIPPVINASSSKSGNSGTCDGYMTHHQSVLSLHSADKASQTGSMVLYAKWGYVVDTLTGRHSVSSSMNDTLTSNAPLVMAVTYLANKSNDCLTIR